jgi:hypothetical protein
MADKPQQSASTQRTPKGLEIPVPKRKDVMDAFRKIVGHQRLICHRCGEPITDRRIVETTVIIDGKRASTALHQDCAEASKRD